MKEALTVIEERLRRALREPKESVFREKITELHVRILNALQGKANLKTVPIRYRLGHFFSKVRPKGDPFYDIGVALGKISEPYWQDLLAAIEKHTRDTKDENVAEELREACLNWWEYGATPATFALRAQFERLSSANWQVLARVLMEEEVKEKAS